jgi:hypothetical protein
LPLAAQLSSLVTLLPFVTARLAPRLVVVKSEALAAAAAEQLQRERQEAAAAAAATAAAEGSSEGLEQHQGRGQEQQDNAQGQRQQGRPPIGSSMANAVAPCVSGCGGPGDVSGPNAERPLPGAVKDPQGWWRRLAAASQGGAIVDNPLWYKAKAKGFKGIHPMKFPDRYTAAGVRICRPFNYATAGCHEGEACPFDHAHCHHCLRRGHLARQCSGGG